MNHVKQQIALSTIAFLLYFGFAPIIILAADDSYKPINDEFSINYETMSLKLFLTHTDYRNDEGIKQKARTKMYDFISNLNTEDSDKKLKTVLSARPMLDAKVKAGISDNFKYAGDSIIEHNKLWLFSYTLDLKMIKEIVPEMELPRQSN